MMTLIMITNLPRALTKITNLPRVLMKITTVRKDLVTNSSHYDLGDDH